MIVLAGEVHSLAVCVTSVSVSVLLSMADESD